MYNYFSKKFSDYIIENSKKYLIFFIPGIKLKEELDWYGYKRAEAFNKLNSKILENDIENRDFFFFTYAYLEKERKKISWRSEIFV